jgi:hypothetical protein
MHVDGKGLRKDRNSDEPEGKRSREDFIYLSNFYKKRNEKKFQEN